MDKSPEAYYAELKYSETITELQVSLFLETWMETIKTILQKHGCTMEIKKNSCLISFPEGTIKTEILPRATNVRYTIILPDQTELMQIQERSGVNHLGFSKIDLP